MKRICCYIFAVTAVMAFAAGCRDRRKYEISIFAEEGVRDPRYVTMGHQGNLILSDHQRIRGISREGYVSNDLLHARDVKGRAFDAFDGAFWTRGVKGLTFDAEERILYLSIGHAIKKMDLNVGKDYEAEILAGERNLSGYEDGLGKEARFNAPSGVALGKNGNVLVADSGNRLIRKITPAGKVSTVAGRVTDERERERKLEVWVDGPPHQATFCRIADLCVDREGNIFVAHVFGGVIRKIDLDGNVSTFVDRTDSYPGVQVGICVDPDGNVFVTNSTRGTLAKITPEGKKTVVGGPSRIRHTWAGRVKHTYYDSRTTRAIGARDGHGASPRGITIDDKGVVYIAEKTHRAILMARPRQK